jgi:hypothetical protein
MRSRSETEVVLVASSIQLTYGVRKRVRLRLKRERLIIIQHFACLILLYYMLHTTGVLSLLWWRHHFPRHVPTFSAPTRYL